MDYNNIPQAIRRLIPATREEFDAFNPAIQQMLVHQATQILPRPDPPPQQPIDLSLWESYSEYYDRHFIQRIYQDYLYGMRHASPLLMTSENIYSLYYYVEEMAANARPDETWDAYQVTLTTSHGYINSSVGSFLNAVFTRIEKYDDQCIEVFDICIRYTNSETAGGRLVAGHGEGIPIPLDKGFWLLDLYASKTRCILNCYVLWLLYQNKEINNTSFYSLRKTIDVKKGSLCIDDLPSHPYLVLYDDITEITPEQTLEKCHYVYRNGHMYLLAHDKYLGNSLSFIKWKSQHTTLTKIASKDISVKTIDIHVMDIESYREKQEDGSYRHVPLMIGHQGLDYICFKGNDCLIDYMRWLVSLNQSMVVWAHNGGNYDFHLIFKSALMVCDKNRDVPIDILDVDGRYIQLSLHLANGHTIYFRDSYALIPGSLNKLAKEFGLEGKLANVDVVNVSKETLLNNPLYRDYNKQDCHVLQQVLRIYRQKGLEEFGTDPLQHPSASSYAKRIFYARYYQPDRYPLYALPRHVHQYIYSSYGGGRCEVFTRGRVNGELYYYDINSSYPNAGTQLLPYGKPKYHDNLRPITQIDQFLSAHPGFYRVKIIKNGHGNPIHGVMHEGKYIFPQFTEIHDITLFSAEIEYGMQHGYKYQLLDGYEFKLGRFCREFFTDMYKRKQLAKRNFQPATEFTCKITSNSGYGFFGYNKYYRNVTRVYGKHMLDHVVALERNGQCVFHQYGDAIVAYETRDVLLDDVNIAVASAITSYARIHLHRLLTETNGKVLYCDTDSLITDQPIDPCLLGDELGQLKNECPEGIDEAVFVSCKLYGYKTKQGQYVVHAKGIREENSVLYSRLIEMLHTPQSFDVWSMITGRVKKAKGDLNVYDTTITKQLNGNYTKRHILNNGDTLPIIF